MWTIDLDTTIHTLFTSVISTTLVFSSVLNTSRSINTNRSKLQTKNVYPASELRSPNTWGLPRPGCMVLWHVSTYLNHTVTLADWTFKKWDLSNFDFQSFLGLIETQNKKIFYFLWRILDGGTNRAGPSWPILKNYQNGTFWSVHGIWNILGHC